MLHGAERWRRKRSGKPSPVLNPPTVAALLAGFGASGYLLTTRTAIGLAPVFAIASLTAVGALTAMTFLMAKWALRENVNAAPPEEEEIHGQVAVVSRTITPGAPGEITYHAWGRKHVLPAESVDGEPVPEGTEVVIEALENGVARIELWAVVEQRL